MTIDQYLDSIGITPGPWWADCRTGVAKIFRVGETHNCLSGIDAIAEIRGQGEHSEPMGYRQMTDGQYANARLIAASRETLKALIKLLIDSMNDYVAFYRPMRRFPNPRTTEAYYTTPGGFFEDEIAAVESATGQKWSEIMEALND